MAAAVLFLRERKRYDTGKQKAKYDVASPYRGNDPAAAAAIQRRQPQNTSHVKRIRGQNGPFKSKYMY
jgi:hypothetical protein